MSHTVRVESIRDLYAVLAAGGSAAYFGEPVTVLAHSLQAAWFVQKEGGGNALIAAALLHDLGHLLHGEGEDAAGREIDTRHEELAHAALAPHMPAAVLEPIRLHVAAKRYLGHAEAAYRAALSPASFQSLALQGGPMSLEEAATFLALPCALDAVTLRRADDAAKVPGLAVPGLEHYRSLVASLWRESIQC